MKLKPLIICLVAIITFSGFIANDSQDYIDYHKQINEAERLLSEEEYGKALIIYERVFDLYDFAFLRDYKVASQLALYLNDKGKAFDYVEKGLSAGWELKDLKKTQYLKPLQKEPEWKTLELSYSNLRSQFELRTDSELREKVRLLFKKDQKKAMGALLRIGNRSQEKYGTEKFAPHSENQMYELIDIIKKHGYTGEKLIGNNFWMSTIISHHNSISLEYSKKDTIYDFIRPKLIRAIEKGEMSPYEFALIDDWKIAVSTERSAPGYGFLATPKKATLSESDGLRQKIGLRPIEVRNKLVEVEKKTGMNFYLPDWINGKINIE